jgi:hypothetical protein
MQAAFMGRKHTTTQNVQAIVDFDLRFTCVLAGCEGSTHNALVLSDTLARPNGLIVPPGTTHYLSDVNLLDSTTYYLLDSNSWLGLFQ